MSTFIRENSGPIAASVLLHGLLAAALVAYTLISLKHTPAEIQPIPIDAQVVDSQVLRLAQQAVADRAAQEAARARAAAEAQAAARKAAEEAAQEATAEKAAEAERAVKAAQEAQAAQAAAEVKREADAKHQQDLHRAAEAQKVQEAKQEARQAEDGRRAAEAKRAEEAKQAAEAKRAAEQKQAEDAKRAADLKAKSEREAELRKQLADEEHINAVTSGPLRDQYIARLQARIQNAWIRPDSARVGLDCLVQVTQVPGGEVTSARVTQCNGDAVTRESIENAVYRASPLPMPSDPALFSRTFAFHFHPDQ